MPEASSGYEVRWSSAGGPPTYVARRRTARVPEGKEAEFAALLQAARFFELPPNLPQDPRARDAGSHTLTVNDGRRSHTVRVGEASLSQGLADLLDWVEANLRPSGG